ncbi:C-type lectin 37Db [Bactrocera dorsalis]|uniref:C-type lectin 37Db n=1 Tax=Bactrocera dorsalis TaxID=27457 RepID=A0ABM3K1N5_BACDO|nr:C-type lectin 37Db [Bactrocera dorsalis]
MNSSMYTTCSSSVQEREDVELQPFIKVGSKYYLVTTPATGMNWFEAIHFCRSYNSDLLTIESRAEEIAVLLHLRELKLKRFRAWTSINDLSVEGTYMSLNSGRPMIYAMWHRGEPNNAGDAEDCTELMVGGTPNVFSMFDNNCLKRQRYIICEKRSPLNNRNSASKSNCENVAWNCGLKKRVEVYLNSDQIY